MEKVADLAHFSALVKDARRPGRKLLSNCYLLPDAIERYTRKGRMTWQSNANGVVFLCEQSDFFHLFYYLNEPLNPEEVFSFAEVQKPVVLDFVVLSGELSESQRLLEGYWSKAGFKFYKQYSRYYLDFPAGERSERYKIRIDPNRYKLGRVTLEEIPAVEALWHAHLDPYSMALPAGEDMEEQVRNGQVLCVRTKDGQIAAVTRPEIHGRTGTNWNLVVDPQHRGQGLASALKYVVYIEHPEVSRMYAWMDDGNTPMIAIDVAIGYQADGKVDRQFILMR